MTVDIRPAMSSSETWRGLPIAQQPGWPDPVAFDSVIAELRSLPPLVTPGECDQLKDRLAAVQRGEAVVLQGGDCAETFAGATESTTTTKLTCLLQVAVVLTYAAQVPVIKIGRLAGQFAEPHPQPTETRGDVTLPAYRGDAVNGLEFSPDARMPDCRRLLRAYHAGAITLNLCRAFTRGGDASLRQVHAWNMDFVATSPAGRRFERIATEIDRALAFMHACGVDPEQVHTVDFWSSHEALLLDYEAALSRVDPASGGTYDLSAHLLWIGDRTRQLDGAHVEWARHIRNPIGVKLGPQTTPADAVTLSRLLNPAREPGRLMFVTRMGADAIRRVLPPIVEAVSAHGSPVVWVCDPMHNTFVSPSGLRTRCFDDLIDEIDGFFAVHRALGTHPGGLHIEFTGEDVTECVGGEHDLAEGDLHRRYETTCDPRLNRRQCLDLAFTVADLYQSR
ncbi:class II 3-deoxy-7-phosphoheptulonate synthase [Nonomuraea sp. K271]|nr:MULTISPECIES: 3-deoxy-7-phosphoheptulonate synthase class II [unclassified Nonomuraea]